VNDGYLAFRRPRRDEEIKFLAFRPVFIRRYLRPPRPHMKKRSDDPGGLNIDLRLPKDIQKLSRLRKRVWPAAREDAGERAGRGSEMVPGSEMV
jgi:hypothetical protein